jgi:hypothetical protein
MGASPEAAGKSPIAGPKDPTRLNVVAVALGVNAIFSLISFNIRIPRHQGTGRGTAKPTDPKTGGLEEVSRGATKLRRAPPREGTQTDTKTSTDTTFSSMAPPAEGLPNPALCTGRDLRFPPPPAGEAAVGGEGTRRSPASEAG